MTSAMASLAMLDSLVCVYGSLPPELTSPLEGLAVLQKETELTILFIHSSIDDCWVVFILAIVNSGAVNICAQVFV